MNHKCVCRAATAKYWDEQLIVWLLELNIEPSGQSQNFQKFSRPHFRPRDPSIEVIVSCLFFLSAVAAIATEVCLWQAGKAGYFQSSKFQIIFGPHWIGPLETGWQLLLCQHSHSTVVPALSLSCCASTITLLLCQHSQSSVVPVLSLSSM